MRAVAQRVDRGSVEVDGEVVGSIERGLLVYVGVGADDTDADVAQMADKLAGLRIFPDEQGRMSRSVREDGGSVLVVSQFTLYGDVRRGRRPSFDGAGAPDHAEALIGRVLDRLREAGLRVETGRFRATMKVSAIVDGPVTVLIDSRRAF